MKLSEILESVSLDKGTYLSARFDQKSKKIIGDFINDNKIPNPTKIDKMHCTIIYSKVSIPDLEHIRKYDKPFVCEPKGLDIWKSKPDDDGNTKNCLVLKLSCPEFKARHKQLMKDNPEATYDYDEFKVHVTLSYDVGDLIKNNLPEFTENLELIGENEPAPIIKSWSDNNKD